jgi:hypothetical protein
MRNAYFRFLKVAEIANPVNTYIQACIYFVLTLNLLTPLACSKFKDCASALKAVRATSMNPSDRIAKLSPHSPNLKP